MNRTCLRLLLISSALMLPLAAPLAVAQTAQGPTPTTPTSTPQPLQATVTQAAVTQAVPALAPDTPADQVNALNIEPVETPIAPTEILPRDYATTLQALHHDDRIMTLDWRRSEQVLRFDLSPNDRIETLQLSLSVTPLDAGTPDGPLTLQFNNGVHHSVDPDGTTTITLDPKRARARGNELRIGFLSGCEAGHAQTTHPKSGGFSIDLRASRLDLRARSDGDGLSMHDLEARLSGHAFAPQTVGLIANGPMATRYQALAAQGLALRMADIPDFRTESVDTDFEFVMATRLELAALDDISLLTTDADVMSGTGPALFLSQEHPTRLYMTGDTADDVLRAISAFATASLPQSRTTKVTPADILVQSPLDSDRRRIDGAIRLTALSVETGTVRTYAFDVSDPEATHGELVLHLKRDSRTSAGAKLTARLNGADLGMAKLNGRRRTVAYPIRPGMLVGSENRLILTTVDARDAPHCTTSDPFIAIGSQSTLQLIRHTPSAPTDLSRLAADGSIFGAQNGANTVFILPETTSDYEASLRVVAQLAKVNGRGWTSADFSRGGTDDTVRHHLVIEPYHTLDLAYKGAAPRTMKAAWRGETVEGRNRVAAYARLNGETAPAVGRIGPGGTAAIFPLDDTRLVGLITNTPDQSFAAALAPLSGPLNWNGLAGGVARWSGNAVVSTQAPLSLPEPDTGPALQANQALESTASGRTLSLPAVDLPDIELSDAGDWIHRRWREISQARQAKPRSPVAQPQPGTRIDGPATAPDSAPNQAPANNPTQTTLIPHSEAATMGAAAGPRALPAHMDGGLLSRIDIWTRAHFFQTREGELHPAILAVMLLLLSGLTSLVLRRAGRTD
ncbi:hypothetical protein ACFFUB_06135 [Algimonas porphyrae]|nr:hypothetical protein [Algimonas porphyrae]